MNVVSADPLAVRGERAQKFAAVRSSVFQRVLYLPLFGFFGSGLEDIECLVARVIGERFEWMKSAVVGTVAQVIRRDTSGGDRAVL